MVDREMFCSIMVSNQWCFCFCFLVMVLEIKSRALHMFRQSSITSYPHQIFVA